MQVETLKLENCWEGFAASAIPEDAPPMQRLAMYQAFLAGADTVCQYYEALARDAPTNVRTGITAWREQIERELQRLVETRQ